MENDWQWNNNIQPYEQLDCSSVLTGVLVQVSYRYEFSCGGQCLFFFLGFLIIHPAFFIVPLPQFIFVYHLHFIRAVTVTNLPYDVLARGKLTLKRRKTPARELAYRGSQHECYVPYIVRTTLTGKYERRITYLCNNLWIRVIKNVICLSHFRKRSINIRRYEGHLQSHGN